MSSENFQEQVISAAVGGAEVNNPAWTNAPRPPVLMSANRKPLPVPVPEGYGLPPLAGRVQLWFMRHWWEFPIIVIVLNWFIVGFLIFFGLIGAFFEALAKNGNTSGASRFIGEVFWTGVIITGFMVFILLIGNAVIRRRDEIRRKMPTTTPSNYYEVEQHNSKLVKNFFGQLRAQKISEATANFVSPQIETLQKFVSERPYLGEMRYVRIVAQYPHLTQKRVVIFGSLERPGYSAPFQAHLVAANSPDQFLLEGLQVEVPRADKHTANKTQFFVTVGVLMAIALITGINSSWTGGLGLAIVIGVVAFNQYRRLY